MFIHNFKYALKTLFGNKMLIFWTFAFPIILGTFFNMAFSNIENSEKLEIINIAIVENEEFEKSMMFKETIKILSDEANEDRLFKTEYTTKETAEELLKNSDITGYVILEENMPKVIVNTNGINETILKYVVEETIQTEEMMNTISAIDIQKEMAQGNYNIDYEKIYNNVLELIGKQEVNIENISNSKLSYTMIEFYTLIAMACLYGGILGMTAINQNLANMSNNGKRVAISPTSKGKVILSSVFASYVAQLLGLALLFIYTIFILKVDYGSNLPLVIALGLTGSLAGLCMGVAIATILKANENIKTGIIISIMVARKRIDIVGLNLRECAVKRTMLQKRNKKGQAMR